MATNHNQSNHEIKAGEMIHPLDICVIHAGVAYRALNYFTTRDMKPTVFDTFIVSDRYYDENEKMHIPEYIFVMENGKFEQLI